MTMLDKMKAGLAKLEPYERDMLRRVLNGDADSDLIMRADIQHALSEQRLATLVRYRDARDREVAQATVTQCLRAIARLPFREG